MVLTDAQKFDLGPTPEPGIYLNVPMARYFDWPYLSKSGLSDFATSPALWYGRATGELPRKKSASFAIGTMTNELWVERLNLGDAGYQIIPDVNPLTDKPMPASGKARQEYLDHVEAQGLKPVSQAMVDKAQAMALALENNDRAQRLHSGSFAEVSIVWRCPHTGLMLKGRPDLVDFDRQILSDLKTTREIRPFVFDGDVSSYNYHWQLYLYLQGLIANGAGTWQDWAPWLITVRNEAPHGVACRPMGEVALEVAAVETEHQLRRWLDCRISNEWPADLLDEKAIDLPQWRIRKAWG